MARIIDKVNTFIVLYLLYFLYRLKEFSDTDEIHLFRSLHLLSKSYRYEYITKSQVLIGLISARVGAMKKVSGYLLASAGVSRICEKQLLPRAKYWPVGVAK